ncbi:MAG: hypothetical protein U9N45_03810 [Gemmatimonadota bacterium]|nr:hypothetical protein [Gemmatimonadota bacterium]
MVKIVYSRTSVQPALPGRAHTVIQKLPWPCRGEPGDLDHERAAARHAEVIRAERKKDPAEKSE